MTCAPKYKAEGPPAGDRSWNTPVISARTGRTQQSKPNPGTKRSTRNLERPQPSPRRSAANGPALLAWPAAPTHEDHNPSLLDPGRRQGLWSVLLLRGLRLRRNQGRAPAPRSCRGMGGGTPRNLPKPPRQPDDNQRVAFAGGHLALHDAAARHARQKYSQGRGLNIGALSIDHCLRWHDRIAAVVGSVATR